MGWRRKHKNGKTFVYQTPMGISKYIKDGKPWVPDDIQEKKGEK